MYVTCTWEELRRRPVHGRRTRERRRRLRRPVAVFVLHTASEVVRYLTQLVMLLRSCLCLHKLGPLPGRTDVSSIMKCILRTLLIVVTQCSTLAATLLCLTCFGLVHIILNTTCLTAAFAFLSGWIRNKHLILIILNERLHYSNPVYLMSPGGYSCFLAEVR